MQTRARWPTAFRRHSLPVVLVNVDGGAPGRTEQARPSGEPPAGWTDLLPEAKPAAGRPHCDEAYVGSVHEHRSRRTPEDAGRHADRDRWRRDQHRRRVDSAPGTRARIQRHARDRRHDRHERRCSPNSVTRIFPRLGETGTTREIIALLDSTRESRGSKARHGELPMPHPYRDGTDRLNPAIWKITSVAVLGSFLSQLDATIVNVSLSSLAVELHSSLSAIQWVTSGYLLALALMLPLNGWLVDRIGAKAFICGVSRLSRSPRRCAEWPGRRTRSSRSASFKA